MRTPAAELTTGTARLKLSVRGAVQGVGFRPFVYRLATELGLCGWVNNSPQGVFIEVEGPSDKLKQFLLRLEIEKPPRSFIQSLESSWLDAAGWAGFEIRESQTSGGRTALVLPDIATCPDCLGEILDPTNRRYRYPFTNCTNCGPRFSIIEALPYDRANTSMKSFTMCPQCQAEHDDPRDRRFHAQPNACPVCGPRLEFWESIPRSSFATGASEPGHVPFPLTPALSPREREHRSQSVRPTDALGWIRKLETGLPLPWGEGWGEGEGRLEYPSSSTEQPRFMGSSADGWPGTGRRDSCRTRPDQDHAALLVAVAAIRGGQIVAVKGLGGFHLLVDARNESAVRRLRERKHREEKPFALMFPSLEGVKAVCEVSSLEERLLRSPEAPIVLLRKLANHPSPIADSVAPGNPNLGVMLPSNPLHHLLMAELSFPVVATSGNLSDEPICTDEHEAVERLRDIADVFLIHNRPIVRPVDDSIVRVMLDRAMVLRRARGYAPLPILVGTGSTASRTSRGNGDAVKLDPTILAVGAHLKNAVALAVDGQVFISQHIGDLETEQAHHAFRRALADLPGLYDTRPEVIAADLHPDYLSTKFAQERGSACASPESDFSPGGSCLDEVSGARPDTPCDTLAPHEPPPLPAFGHPLPRSERGRGKGEGVLDGSGVQCANSGSGNSLPKAKARHIGVQHHIAHVLSCMTDNELESPVLGVAWDGTGWGLDGTIWGGEFFLVSENDIERVAHLRPFRLPGGDAAVREPRRAALGLLHEMFGDDRFCRHDCKPLEAFSAAELDAVTTMLARGLNSPSCCSAGRLFDAVASFSGLCQKMRFEGQAAMELEFALEGVVSGEAYELTVEKQEAALQLDWAPMIEAILADVGRGVPVGIISARFHNALAEAIVEVARHVGERRVALSGGCFQNRYLTERAVTRLRAEGFQPYWHQRVPPNDGGIALGQIVAARRELSAGAARGAVRTPPRGVSTLAN